MRLLRPILLAAGLTLTMSGCGSGGEGPAVTDAERRAGAELHPQLLAEFGGAYSAPEARYLAQVGEKVADAAGLEGQCTFTLVNSNVVNAFAVPGCYIYVTRGLMGIINSEAEFASVLAHEVGHIVGNHSEEQQKRSLWRSLGVAAVGVLSGSERLAGLVGEAAAFFGLRYSRKQEYEADDLGLAYLQAAGYDPHEASEMLGALGRNERYLTRTRSTDDAKSIPEWARTHPLTDNRVARAREAALATGLADNALPEHQARYLAEIDGLLYGDDPAQGFVLGRRFAHPVMRIGFEAPEGFTLTNSAQAIALDGPNGIRGEFGGGAMPRGGLAAYAEALLEQMLGQADARIGTPERTMVNGVEALFLPASVATRDGAVSLSLMAYAGPGGAYHFLMIGPPGEAPPAALQALFGSFRLLSSEEAAQLRPRRIAVVAAGPADTLRTLARRMASDDPLDHMLMLNGRSAEQPLRSGERLKIVSWAGR
ncbi:MAG TPA: M48 family metalloprotease [Allosphingosinicella sp.]|nr:M48 family metalloprotease [Allosphingosinicella sp.]